MSLYTERLILRRWKDSDAEDLYNYAKDPDVGPIAGWQPHKSIEESREIIKNVFCGAEAYAVCLKSDNKAIGAIELMLEGKNHISDKADECELGYWIGKPFWGQGLIPEAARELLRHAFADLSMSKVWCGYYDGNYKSKRVQEKVGFTYQYTNENVDVPLMGEKRTEHISCITIDEWMENKMIKVEVKYILKPGQRDAFYNAIIAQGIDKAAQNEDGNIKYEFDIPEEKDILYLHELWRDNAALTAHSQMPHYKALGTLKEKYVIETVIDKE